MPTSKVSIANGALQRLGAAVIASLTADSPNARSMNRAFERVLRSEMRRYAWNFAIARESIAADANGPTWGDWNRYTKPNDFVRLIRNGENGRVDWKVEGNYILSMDASPLEIRYLAYVEDPNLYDPCFIEAVECKLAMVTCKEITGSTGLKDDIRFDYDEAVNAARSANAIEKEDQEFPEDSWLLAML